MSLVLPPIEWPCADQTMWTALWKVAHPLDDPGAFSHLRKTTKMSLEPKYGRWIKWLSVYQPDALALAPAERASLPRLKAWVEALGYTRPMTQLAFVDGVLRILRAAAPDHDWTLQLRLRATLKRAAGRGDPARKQGRIVASSLLLSAGLAYADGGATPATKPLGRLIQHRDGTMVALMAVLPMRLRSFSELALGRSLHVTDDSIFVSLSAEMTKTGVPWEAEVPRQVEPVLRSYITETRPALLRRGQRNHTLLWVGRKGESIDTNSIRLRISEVTLKQTGKRVSPHLFRDAAATSLARISPESAQLIRPVLSHAGFRTAERHYIHARTIEAGRDYAALVASKKGKAR
ncbi:hypothetical protein EU805_16470 [Salipiger sp. IMCC34102]|uniref:tyrosine-type recombinase/integrase n=1 Tax=Salipiger sp. IMCC34102 TaxID=2510647 RepID=UPI00101DBFC9|nr:tyrosine-type recombinase/integrase [Salipiger sp. IMCC34102]RYH00904.1 hypothetical protein EU805_16470 [Salipiger sp. IMCC34102]